MTRYVYVQISEGETAHTGQLSEGKVVTHRDRAGQIVAIEIPAAIAVRVEDHSDPPLSPLL